MSPFSRRSSGRNKVKQQISTQGERRPPSRMMNFGGHLLRVEHRCVHNQIVELSAIANCRKNLDARARCQLSRHLRHVGFEPS